MVQLNQPGWMRTLAEVEQAIQGCLNSLDRYEKAFGKAYAEVKDATDGRRPSVAIPGKGVG